MEELRIRLWMRGRERDRLTRPVARAPGFGHFSEPHPASRMRSLTSVRSGEHRARLSARNRFAIPRGRSLRLRILGSRELKK